MATEPKSLRGTRVLVVTGDTEASRHIASLLRSHGARVECATYAGEALLTHVALVPDVLLVDMDLEGQDGLALVRRVRALPPEKGGRVAAATLSPATLDGQDRDDWSGAGVQAHLTTPVDGDELVAMVRAMCGRPAERRNAQHWPRNLYRERRNTAASAGR
jgi:CheY-like chemotaxis protein